MCLYALHLTLFFSSMITLGESLEATRKEKFMGWYHSHPFDLGEHSHCFLSQTDLTTQLQWQRAEDPHGNPFVAIVVDPLRSAHTEHPELKAFRAYPPEYNSPVPNECPNKSIETSEQARLELWGSCWNRYYELEVEYFMSTTSRQVIVEGLTQDSLWMRNLVQAPPTLLSKNLVATAKEFRAVGTGSNNAIMVGETSRPKQSSSSSRLDSSSSLGKEWNKAVQHLTDVAVEQLGETSLQDTKKIVFG